MLAGLEIELLHQRDTAQPNDTLIEREPAAEAFLSYFLGASESSSWPRRERPPKLGENLQDESADLRAVVAPQTREVDQGR